MVIAIIALLVGVLLPALGKARAAGRAAVCLSNIRQLELAHALYLNDSQERFIDAGLADEVGEDSTIEGAWPVVLAKYAGPALAPRSPVDRSSFWPIAQGGTSDGADLKRVIELAEANNGKVPAGTKLARWTSYGLNGYTTTFAAPHVDDPDTGKHLGPWNRLSAIERPWATNHFLMMTQGNLPGSEAFATVDHAHPNEWFEEAGSLEGVPGVAATQVDIGAHSEQSAAYNSRASYGFLDGHAATLRFNQVYKSDKDNAFWPDVAR